MSSEPDHLDKIRERFTGDRGRVCPIRSHYTIGGRKPSGRVRHRRPRPCRDALAIDVACGPAHLPAAGRARPPRGGRGPDSSMVEKARAEALRDGIANIEFICADVYALPFLTALRASCPVAMLSIT